MLCFAFLADFAVHSILGFSMNGWIGFARATVRTAIFPPLALLCNGDFALSGAGESLPSRVKWLRRTAVRHAKWIGLKVRVHGEVPTEGLIVANHISYLDILAMSIAGGFAFVAKKEVARWPIFGAFARMGGSVFVDREQRGAVATVADDMREHLRHGVPVALFPEGTSTGGDVVLPFRSSLFDPVVKLGCAVTACGVRYSLPGGSVEDEVAFWRDMDLAPHLWNLLHKTGLTVDIHFGAASQRTADRKTLAREMRAEVCLLAGLPV